MFSQFLNYYKDTNNPRRNKSVSKFSNHLEKSTKFTSKPVRKIKAPMQSKSLVIFMKIVASIDLRKVHNMSQRLIQSKSTHSQSDYPYVNCKFFTKLREEFLLEWLGTC